MKTHGDTQSHLFDSVTAFLSVVGPDFHINLDKRGFCRLSVLFEFF